LTLIFGEKGCQGSTKSLPIGFLTLKTHIMMVFSIIDQVVKSDGTVYVMYNEITLTNYAMRYLFSLIKYILGSATIESIDYPGQVTSMLGYATYPDDFLTSSGLKCC